MAASGESARAQELVAKSGLGFHFDFASAQDKALARDATTFREQLQAGVTCIYRMDVQ